MADKIRNFFNSIERSWDAIPSYVKVFFYSSVSSIFGLWIADLLSVQAVAIIVMTNLGLYQVPRQINKMVQ